MNSLPLPWGTGEPMLWRLDDARFASGWETGEGAFRQGGRWNSAGVRAVYAALDPATAILEVAVHKGFRALDTVPHVMTAARIVDRSRVHVVRPEAVPNVNWLRPGLPSAGMQMFGDALLERHAFVLVPSVVSIFSWTVVFVAASARDAYQQERQGPFALDTRLHPPRR